MNIPSSFRNAAVAALVLVPLVGCRPSQAPSMNSIAESYVKLVLATGKHDANYVDAFYGPAEWKTNAESLSLDTIRARAAVLVRQLGDMHPAAGDTMAGLRHSYLTTQLNSMIAHVEQLGGRRLTFDEEAKALYDVTVPTHTEDEFRATIAQLDSVLPGRGPVPERYTRFKQGFVIPPARVDTVFRAAVAACRQRTAAHLTLPDSESFTIEYVKDKPWSGYNWYQGHYRSLIQVNTELPIFIDRAIDLACHEGYPGHHVYNAMLEKSLVRDRGWVEYSVYPLFSPQSLIAEGSANYGIEVAFPGAERTTFEHDVLYPLAGLDPAKAAQYARVQALAGRLSYAGNEAARRLLDGAIDSAAAVKWLEDYALYDHPRAQQRVRFIRTYRSYVINYNLGKDLVANYVERAAAGDAAKRWRVFGELLSSPRLPSGLQ
jgi:hypothetical protein